MKQGDYMLQVFAAFTNMAEGDTLVNCLSFHQLQPDRDCDIGLVHNSASHLFVSSDKVVICKRQIILICAGTVATTSILPFHSLWNFNDSFTYSIVICYFLIKCNSKKYCKCQSN